MKMTKILATAAVAAVVAFGFMACAAEEDDDELKAITGSNNDYSINFPNTGNDMYRAYATTYNKHLGGLCQITIEKDAVGDGSIGYMFDLESNPARAEKDPRTFCLVGFNLATPGTAKPYVSRYNNITDIQAVNFGATVNAPSGPSEKEYIELGSKLINLADCEVNGKYVLTVDVNGSNKDTGYVVNIYKGKVEKNELTSKEPFATTTIPATDLYPTTKKLDQKSAAVYVNVYAGKTMKAEWHYADTYSADEIAE